MITVFKTPSNEQFFNLVKSSEHELLFCAPFIKKEIIDIILIVRDLQELNADILIAVDDGLKRFHAFEIDPVMMYIKDFLYIEG